VGYCGGREEKEILSVDDRSADPAAASPTRPGFRQVSAVFSHIAASNEGGVSFLELLQRRFPYHSAEEWTSRILTGQVLLEGAVALPDSPILPRMRLEYRVDSYDEPAVPINFHEIVQEGDLALVHKPAGLPVHKTGKVFVNVLANLYRAFKGDDAWTPLNRLDVETSGIVAFARGREALRRWSPGTPGTAWTKTYLAVVQGAMTNPFVHDGPLAEWPEHAIRSRVRVHPEGKAARTHFEPLQTADGATLVRVRLETGRKHQIRAHLADSGFPILGDKVYSLEGRYYLKRLEGELDAEDLTALGASHHLLHAVSLELRDAEGFGIRGTDPDLPEGFQRRFPGLDGSKLEI
jgi:23S rRNA pseudouridine1911/1915/1917 synthase